MPEKLIRPLLEKLISISFANKIIKMHHQKLRVLYLISLLIIGGCAAPELKDLSLNPGQCLFFGKIKVFYKGKPVSTSVVLSFSEFGKSGPSRPIGVDGRLAAKVSLTNNFLGTLFFNSGALSQRFTKFNPQSLLIMPLETGKAYYIGDITFNLDKDNSDLYNNNGLIGYAISKSKPTYKVCPQIDSLSQEERTFLKTRYPGLNELIYNPVVCQ